MKYEETELKRTWIPTLLSGLALSILGVLTVVWPDRTLSILAVFLGGFFLADGIFNIMKGVMAPRDNTSWILVILIGVAQIALGIYLFRDANFTTRGILLPVGAFFALKGLADIAFAYMSDVDRGTQRTLVILGILALIAGIYLVTEPDYDAITFVYTFGGFAITAGAIMMGLARRFRRADDLLEDDLEDTATSTRRNPRTAPAPAV
jgi:uncharacterized membrane protein HdeD (DUF308 family)